MSETTTKYHTDKSDKNAVLVLVCLCATFSEFGIEMCG